MNIDTESIPQTAVSELMRSLGAALQEFRRSPDYTQKINDYKNKRERNKEQ